MIARLWWAWLQVWPNLAASAITGTLMLVWHNRRLHRLRDELKEHLEIED